MLRQWMSSANRLFRDASTVSNLNTGRQIGLQDQVWKTAQKCFNIPLNKYLRTSKKYHTAISYTIESDYL